MIRAHDPRVIPRASLFLSQSGISRIGTNEYMISSNPLRNTRAFNGSVLHARVYRVRNPPPDNRRNRRVRAVFIFKTKRTAVAQYDVMSTSPTFVLKKTKKHREMPSLQSRTAFRDFPPTSGKPRLARYIYYINSQRRVKTRCTKQRCFRLPAHKNSVPARRLRRRRPRACAISPSYLSPGTRNRASKR